MRASERIPRVVRGLRLRCRFLLPTIVPCHSAGLIVVQNWTQELLERVPIP